MLGYNVLVIYLRTIGNFLLALKKYVKNITLGSPHFSEGEGGHEKCAHSPLFCLFIFLTLPL